MELAALTGRQATRIQDFLPWVLLHQSHLEERAAAWHGPRYRQSEFSFLPPVLRPAAFRDFDAFEVHVKACRARAGLGMPEPWYEAPLFHFANRLSLVGQGGEVCAPSGSRELDFGLALGVVIGRRGREIPMERAWDYVAGFTVVNDLCARDLETKTLSAGLWPAKGKDFATAVGPWLSLRNGFAGRIQGERLQLAMSAHVNGRLVATADTASLHHSIPAMIAHASADAELFPGDLLSTGAAGGGSLLETGAGLGGWLKPGDRVSLEVECIGTLDTHIVARSTLGYSGTPFPSEPASIAL
jgi:fumarylacetoacetate (FAA) hydrolase